VNPDQERAVNRRCLLAAPLLAAGVLVAPLSTTPAQGQALTYSVIHVRIKVSVPNCDDDPVSNALPLKETIAADLYKPNFADATHRVPAILTTNGFGGSKDDQAGLGAAFASHGYAVLSYSGLGFGGSSCRIFLDDRDHDGASAAQLVDYLGGEKRIGFVDKSPDPPGPVTLGDKYDINFVQLDHTGKKYDPRVGMVGGSYGGEIQYAATAASNGRIDAIVPVITWNNLAYSLAPNNTSFTTGVNYTTPGVHKKEWTSLFFADGIAAGTQFFAEDPPSRSVDPTSMFPTCVNFASAACSAKAHLDATGYPDTGALDLTRAASVTSYLDKITIPTLLMQGQADTLFNLQESVATYEALRKQGTMVGLVWQSWGHSQSTPAAGEYNADAPLGTYQGDLVKGWFDHYLKGLGGDPQVGFRYFRDWAYRGATPRARANAAYATAPTYPVGTPVPLYLSGGNAPGTTATLTPTRARSTSGTYSFIAPVNPASYSETSGVQDKSPVQSPFDTAGTVATYTTAPLSKPADVVGIPTLDVKIASPGTVSADPATELVVFAKIYDLAPGGGQTLIHGLVSPVRLSSVGDRVHITMPGIVHRFDAGHSLQLVIAGSDFAYGAETNGGNDVAHLVQILNDKTNPGVLALPVTNSPVAFASSSASTGGTSLSPGLSAPGGGTSGTGTSGTGTSGTGTSGSTAGTGMSGTGSGTSTAASGSQTASGTSGTSGMSGTSATSATSSPGVPTAVASRSSGRLPFTGFEAGLVLALGGGLVAAGAAIRAAAHRTRRQRSR